jgi:SAM-dependent methyltransferase
MTSFLYKNPVIYEKILFLIHRSNFSKRYKLIASLVGKNKKVLDLGCGSGVLAKYLDPSCEYVGIEANSRFANYCRKKGLNVVSGNLFEVEFPEVDVAVISDVLHHILPNHKELLSKAQKSAKALVICEPKHEEGKVANILWFNRFFFNLFGDNDGINSYESMKSWDFSRSSLQRLLSEYGKTKTFEVGESIVASVDDYLDLFGQPGKHEQNLQVFRKNGKPCPRCSSVIKKTRVGGRGTHYCPNCQVKSANSQQAKLPI